MNTQRLLLVGVGIVAFSLTAGAADWPQWRGPERSGISKETGLLKEWPKEGPKLVWQVKDIGNGYSTPAVVDGHLYLLSNRDKDESVLALDAKNGKEVWSMKLGKVGANVPQADYAGARSTPTVDGNLLYCLGSDGDLVCLERAQGKEVWRKNLRTDFEGKPGSWAYAESPLIDGDVLVCTPGGKSTLVALNKKTGAVIWKSEVPGADEAAYASVTIAEAGGVKQYVQFLGKGVVGVDAKTGKFLWRYGKTAQGSLANIPTPVFHNGYVYSATGMAGSGLAKLKSDKGTFEAEQVYFAKTLPNSIGGVVRIGDYLYGTTNKELLCVEFTTGKVKWHHECVGAGSICYADGCFYLHGENNDEVVLVEATPDEYREKGHFTLPDQPKHDKRMEKAWAYPVVANGRLYLRDLNMLWCYDIKAAKDEK